MFQRATLVAVVLAAIAGASAQSQVYGQCGGIGWTGATTCVSGSTCVVSNDYYSQCLPGSSPTTGGGVTTTRTTAQPTSTGGGGGNSGLPRLKGVNMAGYDFTVTIDGSFTGVGYSPPTAQFSHFASEGVNVFRVPFAWQLMTPSLGGTISSSFFSKYDATVQTALNTGAYVILDLHNYARWNGQIINQGGPTNAQYASLWSQVAAKYKNNQKIIFGIMNEPHDVQIAPWVTSVQAAVNAIRAAGATQQFILIPGSSFSSAAALPTEAGPQLLGVTDPSGGKSKLIFDVHKYLDSDNSGTHRDCTTDNLGVFQTLNSWLAQNGRQALLTETGGGNTQSCYTALKSQLNYIKSASNILGFTIWSAGSFDTTYELTVTPNADGSDQPIWTNAVRPNL